MDRRAIPPAHLAEPLRWARSNGWRPKYPRTRRDGLHTWVDAERRITVRLDIGGQLQVYQRRHDGVHRILDVQVGCWQHVFDALTVHSILPPQKFNTAYVHRASASPQQEQAREVARTLLAAMAEAIRADVDPTDEDAGDRLALAAVFEAARPYVGDRHARALVLPISRLAQRMYRAATAEPDAS